MLRRGWEIGLAALLALVEPRAADALETTPAWQADLGMLTSVTDSQNSRDPLPVLFADGTAVMLGGAAIDGAVPAVSIDPGGVMSRMQSRLHVESQRWLVPQAVQARSDVIALVSLKVMQGTTSNGDVLVGIDRGGSVLWSRRGARRALANDDGSFWLAHSATLERVAADGSRQPFVEVEAV